MSTSADDQMLLRQYAEETSEEAFAELVKRHLDHTYSAALREANDPHLAADLTQAAFLLLAGKAAKLKASPSVAGWLFARRGVSMAGSSLIMVLGTHSVSSATTDARVTSPSSRLPTRHVGAIRNSRPKRFRRQEKTGT